MMLGGKFQKLYDYIYNMVVKHGVVDEGEVKKHALRYARNIGLVEDLGNIRKVICEINKDINQLKEEVRLPGEPFDRVTLKHVFIRRNYPELAPK